MSELEQHVRVVVDIRETKLYNYLRSLIPDGAIKLEQETLEIADIHVTCNNPNITLLFERKSVSDLAASIKDSRYKEQKFRMLSACAPHHITYVVEGTSPIAQDEHGLRSSVYYGMYAHTMYRDGMHVVHVNSTKETAMWIANVANKLHTNPQKFINDQVDEYICTRKAKTRKIDNITPYNCYLMQLSQIPGISLKVAESIASRFPSMSSLILALNNCETDNEKESLFATIPLIGPKKSNTIIEYLRDPK